MGRKRYYVPGPVVQIKDEHTVCSFFVLFHLILYLRSLCAGSRIGMVWGLFALVFYGIVKATHRVEIKICSSLGISVHR